MRQCFKVQLETNHTLRWQSLLTIEILDACNVILVKPEVSELCRLVEWKHQSPINMRMVKTQGVTKLMGSNKEKVDS